VADPVESRNHGFISSNSGKKAASNGIRLQQNLRHHGNTWPRQANHGDFAHIVVGLNI